MSDQVLVQQWEELSELLQSVETDLRKTEGGNAAAGRRVRKLLREVKSRTAELSKATLEHTRK